jgi:hypothetical protein
MFARDASCRPGPLVAYAGFAAADSVGLSGFASECMRTSQRAAFRGASFPSHTGVRHNSNRQATQPLRVKIVAGTQPRSCCPLTRKSRASAVGQNLDTHCVAHSLLSHRPVRRGLSMSIADEISEAGRGMRAAGQRVCCRVQPRHPAIRRRSLAEDGRRSSEPPRASGSDAGKRRATGCRQREGRARCSGRRVACSWSALVKQHPARTRTSRDEDYYSLLLSFSISEAKTFSSCL